ncbi:hypothetical protein L0666_00350 [Octadecabacter sp. CECT 8868]|uniref:hypothetical protein n=1 Tax=Octadecabacter algicola TaxID=2909342 RepID=UPI001F42BEC0|nr:hypothetical protein [Octadecabacter algicola]MCF2903424.1 hypothetical protein [Octadecabacter algicola]
MSASLEPIDDVRLGWKAIESHSNWIEWAQELIPSMVDMNRTEVFSSLFGQDGTARSLIWDLLDHFERGGDEVSLNRAFEFVLRCAKSEEVEVSSPAFIGFFCKISQGNNPVISIEDLAQRLPNDILEDYSGLWLHHYGLSGFERMRAANKAKGATS